MPKKILFSLLSLITVPAMVTCLALSPAHYAGAQTTCDGTSGIFSTACQNFYKARGQNTSLTRQTLPVRLSNYLNWIMGSIGLIGVVWFTLGAYKYLVSAGAADKVKEAKNQMIYTIIGLLVLLMAYSITSFVLSRIIGATV